MSAGRAAAGAVETIPIAGGSAARRATALRSAPETEDFMTLCPCLYGSPAGEIPPSDRGKGTHVSGFEEGVG